MKFYTSVEQAGNRLLVRGYENGNRYSVRFPSTLRCICLQKIILSGEH